MRPFTRTVILCAAIALSAGCAMHRTVGYDRTTTTYPDGIVEVSENVISAIDLTTMGTQNAVSAVTSEDGEGYKLELNSKASQEADKAAMGGLSVLRDALNSALPPSPPS